MPTHRLPRPPAVGRVLERVAAAARRHDMFEPGTRVLVAVSGGPDSICLLHSLVRLRRLLRIRVGAFHFDHRLRPGSDADGRYVRRQASSLEVPLVIRAATSRPGRGESVEAWARTVRYEAIAAALEELGGGVAAVAHTADDQAETVLLALFRGGGLEAIGGMAPVARPLVRPMLDVTRVETEAFCRSLHLRPRRDPMNDDLAFMRVGVRRGVIPVLEEALGRNIRSTLVRSAEHLRRDGQALDEMARAAQADVLERRPNEIRMRARALAALPPALAGRVVRLALLGAGIAPEAGHVESVLDLAGGRPGRRSSLPDGLLAERAREYVRLSRPSPPSGLDVVRRAASTLPREGTDGDSH